MATAYRSWCAFMLTGSFALAYYATPRMTRDIELVVALDERDIDSVVAVFASDFYIDADAARVNFMHLQSGVEIELSVRKSALFRQVEFARREMVEIANVRTWIDSCQDLILSKLVWALELNLSCSAMISGNSSSDLSIATIRKWAQELSATALLAPHREPGCVPREHR